MGVCEAVRREDAVQLLERRRAQHLGADLALAEVEPPERRPPARVAHLADELDAPELRLLAGVLREALRLLQVVRERRAVRLEQVEFSFSVVQKVLADFEQRNLLATDADLILHHEIHEFIAVNKRDRRLVRLARLLARTRAEVARRRPLPHG